MASNQLTLAITVVGIHVIFHPAVARAVYFQAFQRAWPTPYEMAKPVSLDVINRDTPAAVRPDLQNDSVPTRRSN